MKSTGIVRRIDDLGRVVIPMELRKVFDMPTGTPIEIYTEGDSIILHKYQNKCEFCGSTENITVFKDKIVCSNCLNDLKGL